MAETESWRFWSRPPRLIATADRWVDVRGVGCPGHSSLTAIEQDNRQDALRLSSELLDQAVI